MKIDLMSLVESKIVERGPGFKSWFDCLEDDRKAELLKIRDRFREGGYGATTKSAIARAIIAAASEQGWKTSGLQGVIHWLNQ
jgi:hypothetical protein